METQTLKRKLGRLKQSQTIMGDGNPHWKGGQINKHCVRCGSEFKVYPSTLNRTHCSLTCANRDMADAQRGIVNPKKIHYGIANGAWRGGNLKYICAYCDKPFTAKRGNMRICCSRYCAKKLYLKLNPDSALIKSGYRFKSGNLNINWKGGITDKRQLERGAPEMKRWSRLVLERDWFACQDCGQETHNVQAHHIRSWAEYPELRYEVNNGITLCVECHKVRHKGNLISIAA